MTDPLHSRRVALQRQIEDAQRQLEAMETLPVHDTYPDGTIIRANIKYGSRVSSVTYVFLKVETGEQCCDYGVRWYHTGYVNHDRAETGGAKPYFVSWAELVRWLTDRLRTVETWDVVYPLSSPRATVNLSPASYLDDRS